jgi:hypothetical protein
MVSKRITIEGVKIERAIDITKFVAVAGGVRFAVLMAPDQAWSGIARKTFTILGSARVMIHGPTTIAELLLESDNGCNSGGGL